jgi:hypothetical protein
MLNNKNLVMLLILIVLGFSNLILTNKINQNSIDQECFILNLEIEDGIYTIEEAIDTPYGDKCDFN